MKSSPIRTSLASALLLAATLGYVLYDANPPPRDAGGLATDGAESITTAHLDAPAPEAAVPLLDEPAAPAGQPVEVPYRAMHLGAGEFTSEEIAEYNRFAVIPFNPIIGQDCTEQPDPQFGGIGPEYLHRTCETRWERTHPYTRLPDQELTNLAVTDAEAALILGKRLAEEEAHIFWMLRAAALASKSGPLLILAEEQKQSAFRFVESDAGPVIALSSESVARGLALERVAAKLGDPRADAARWKPLVAGLGADAADAARAQAEAYEGEIFALLVDVEETVTGAVWAREARDA